MMNFAHWFAQEMFHINREATNYQSNDDCDWVSFNGKFGVIYVKQPITVDTIKGFFRAMPTRSCSW